VQITKLKIFGFKSFAQRTEINFPTKGLTAVVGPNGCGKSNITDAIRTGEKSRVYEEDWVGTFNLRVRTIERVNMTCDCDHLEHKEGVVAMCVCPLYVNGEYFVEDLEFEGGSEYVVFSNSENGHGLHYEFK